VSLELPVRMGIATGEAERRGDDYFGATLNRAARVMGVGYGGQILSDRQFVVWIVLPAQVADGVWTVARPDVLLASGVCCATQ
jgi:hypothetical protein